MLQISITASLFYFELEVEPKYIFLAYTKTPTKMSVCPVGSYLSFWLCILILLERISSYSNVIGHSVQKYSKIIFLVLYLLYKSLFTFFNFFLIFFLILAFYGLLLFNFFFFFWISPKTPSVISNNYPNFGSLLNLSYLCAGTYWASVQFLSLRSSDRGLRSYFYSLCYWKLQKALWES